MYKTPQPGRNAIIVKNIVGHVNSFYDMVKLHTFVFTPQGEQFYEVAGQRIPAKEFEKAFIQPLQKNQQQQDKSPDPRAIN